MDHFKINVKVRELKQIKTNKGIFSYANVTMDGNWLEFSIPISQEMYDSMSEGDVFVLSIGREET